MKKILLIDYKLGNHQSVANTLTFLGYDFLISNSPANIKRAQAYILPGVGAFPEAMKNLKAIGIVDVLAHEVIKRKKPILGVCLGMQILANDSVENGFHKGLGWVSGHVAKVPPGQEIRVPHVGWNNIHAVSKNPLFSRVSSNTNFYFDHSYHFVCNNKFVAATFIYGHKMIAAIQKDNIFGVQFHPEKSQNNGLRIYRSFFNYCGIN